MECPWRLTLANENDNKLFGTWSYLSGGRDGNDTGRTHALRLSLAKTFARGITAEVQLSTELFTQRDGSGQPQVDASGNPLFRDGSGKQGYLTPEVYVDAQGDRVDASEVVSHPDGSFRDASGQALTYYPTAFLSKSGQLQELDASTAAAILDRHHVGIVFNEINRLSWLVDNARQRQKGYWKAGAALLLTNRETVSWGGTGQQKAVHGLINKMVEHDYFEYDYHPDGGGIRAGFSTLVAGGIDSPLWRRRRFRLLGRAEGGMVLSAVPRGVAVAGTQLYGHLRLQGNIGRLDERGDPVFSLSVEQETNAYVTLPVVEAISRFEAVLYTRPIDLLLSLHVYYADPVRAYYVYNENNSTMEIGLRGKFGR